WLPGGAGVYHYAPRDHALEQRARRSPGAKPDAAGFCVGLASITWREAWKYGERAFRYCQHDVVHALAALRYAAAALGWRVELLPEWDDAQLARLLGLDRTEDFADAERETPELLVRVMVNETAEPAPSPVADAPVEWFGRANQLSRSHVGWPVIDEAIAASERKAPMADRVKDLRSHAAWSPPAPQRGEFRRRHRHHARKVSGHSGYHAAAGIRAAVRRVAISAAVAPGFVRASGHGTGTRHVPLAARAGGRGHLAARLSRRSRLGSPGGPGPHGAAPAVGTGGPARFRADLVLPAGHCRRRSVQPRHAGAVRTGLAGTRRGSLARVVLGVRNDRPGAVPGRRGRRGARHGHWLLL